MTSYEVSRKREISLNLDNSKGFDDSVSMTSTYQREHEIKETNSKVKNFLDPNIRS